MSRKLRFLWRDPDWADDLREQVGRDIPDELWDQLYELGLGKYLEVEVDTEAHTARIVTKGG